MIRNKSATKRLLVLIGSLGLAACGGGGGGGDTGVTPPPVASDTYSVQLVDISLVDTRDGAIVDPTGLPITGATVTRN